MERQRQRESGGEREWRTTCGETQEGVVAYGRLRATGETARPRRASAGAWRGAVARSTLNRSTGSRK
eukprot:1002430-Pleurochrysis_carterae.AAC.1